MDIRGVNVLVLAYLGDTIYEDYIRKFLISKGINNVNELQKQAVNYVSAKSQCSFLHKLIDNSFLTDEEIDVVKRARNYKVTYKYATGLEALIGYLELLNDKSRIDEIMDNILEG